MPQKQYYGIKFPLSSENRDLTYLDLDKNYLDSVKSTMLHILFTPKGQKLRDPNFGSELIKYIFEPNDGQTMNDLLNSLNSSICHYLPDVIIQKVDILEGDDNSKAVYIKYVVTQGNKEYEVDFGIKI